MLARLLSITSLAILAIATPLAQRTASQCDTGNIQCCKQTETVAEYNRKASMKGLVPISVGALNNVGLECTPITVIGTGSGGTCTQEPVCCNNDKFNGVVNVGCTPINIGI